MGVVFMEFRRNIVVLENTMVVENHEVFGCYNFVVLKTIVSLRIMLRRIHRDGWIKIGHDPPGHLSFSLIHLPFHFSHHGLSELASSLSL